MVCFPHIFLLVLASSILSGKTSAETGSWPENAVDIPFVARIVVVPDIHGDLDAAMTALKVGRVLDGSGQVILGQGDVVVFLGDLADRGPSTLKVYDMVSEIASAAPRFGARVLRLVGNHELMLLQGDLRYVNRRELQEVGGHKQFSDLFTEEGEYGREIRQNFLPMARINSTLFVHAGYSPIFALPPQELGGRMLAQLRGVIDSSDKVWHGSGPLWYRGLVNDEDRCDQLGLILEAAVSQRMIVGHTPQDEIHSECDGRLILADHGMSRWLYSGLPTVVEIIGNQMFAVNEFRRTPL